MDRGFKDHYMDKDKNMHDLVGMVTTLPRCNFHWNFQKYSVKIVWAIIGLSLTESKIMHCGILIARLLVSINIYIRNLINSLWLHLNKTCSVERRAEVGMCMKKNQCYREYPHCLQ